MQQQLQSKSLEFLRKNKVKNVITKNYKEALLVGEVAKYLKIPYVVLPDFRANFGDDMRSYKEEIFELNSALFEYYNSNSLLIAPVSTIMRQLPIKKYFSSIKLEFADKIILNELKDKLIFNGYEIVSIIQEKGEVSFKENIIEIYPINSKIPYRIFLLDNEIESIKKFDEFTQISEEEELENIEIIPALANLSKKEYEEIIQKIEKNKFDVFYKDIYSLGFWFLEKVPIDKEFNFIYDLSDEINEFREFNKDFFKFEINLIKDSVCKDFKPKNIKEFIELNPTKNIEILAKNEVLLKEKNINYPFIKSDVVLNIQCPEKTIISLNEFNFEKKKLSKILIDDLKKGDFVVHQTHGIGKFMGLKQVQVLGKTGEFAEIRYYNDDKLLLPIENLNLIDRYIASGGVIPSLDKMGKSTFSKNKQKVQEKIFAIAMDIIKVSALRETILSKKMRFDGVEKFINDAGFSYTPDQKKAVEEIIEEMKSRVMDRLLSGDVGFGKTEIAMVASFIAVNSGYQVAIVAPTTILVSQHYETFIKRFEKYNFKIAKLDRFTSSKDKKLIEKEIKDGKIDIILATHSAFNLEYKNLGLVIIDEEHKFGVKQKEKLKNMVENVHLLSMSATPIPRSLNLALSKIKGFSALNIPPKTKQETRTFVKEYSDQLIKEIIFREIRRGGQLFYIYNNIAGIEIQKEKLQRLMPNLRILVLHAKLTPVQIEKSMIDFINKKYDLIIATTILESGIHIPNVNTIIVENADRFGIADLHQIRGRVGRGDKEGYAYFIVKNRKEISENAKKRLLALEENSFLGSGAVLAMHDLEIRGGGNIIGEAQSGQIKNVGYAMYIKLLEDALKELTGEESKNEKDVEIRLNINAYISPKIIEDERVRIEIYRRTSLAKTFDEVYKIEKELIDRFGKVDTPTSNFLEKIKIKILAMQKNIKSISNYGENITIISENDKKFIKAKAKDDEIILETILKELEK